MTPWKRGLGLAALWALVGGLLAREGFAALPSPLDGTLFSFPSAVPAPASAAQAGLGFSGRWLGEDPFDNPALLARRGLVVSPLIQRLSRQDLRAQNRGTSDQAAFLDAAGAWLGAEILGIQLGLYVSQPVLRLEDVAFNRGIPNGNIEPATVRSSVSAREVRSGLAVSREWGIVRLGVAGEWTERRDRYEFHEQSGSPNAGDRTLEFSGGGVGGQAGARLHWHQTPLGTLTVGLAARYLPKNTLAGSQSLVLVSGASETDVAVVREQGWEGGVSVRAGVTPAFAVLASAGGRTAQEWRGFGVTSGRSSHWSAGFEYHDHRDPWTVRFGAGAELQDAVPEPRAGLFGLGFGWSFGTSRVDVGAVRRTLVRGNEPHSFDDRIVGSLGFQF